MDSTHNSVKTKVNDLIDELKKLSNFKLEKLNINLVLLDTSTNKVTKITVDESRNFTINTKSKEETESEQTAQSDATSDVSDTTSDEETTELRSISSNNTLSTKIFEQSTVSDSEMQTPASEVKPDKESGNGLRGGFLKSNVTLSDLLGGKSLSNDLTSELKTVTKNTVDNVFTKQSGGYNKSNQMPNTLSQTSDAVMPNLQTKYSATSISATSNAFSATSPMQGGAYPVNYSATSALSGINGINELKGGFNKITNYSETSELTVKKYSMKGGNRNYSETPELGSTQQNKPSNNITSKLDLIKRQIRELEVGSDRDVFYKTQAGGAKNFDKIRKEIGINSSSTSDVCE